MQQKDVPNLTYLNDRDLLRRFVQDVDEAAFAEIVRRHQGLVLSVCRRVLGEHPEVDDAFQATFLALARRPRQIRKLTTLSSWLYTVAWRISWKLVKARLKKEAGPLVEDPIDNSDDPLDRVAMAHDCVVLDEELNGLPQRFREVLVLTYFAERTSQQIADELNLSKGAVDGRIRDARNMLRTRLARRGIAVGALTAAAALSHGNAAMASPELLHSTVQLGTQAFVGGTPPPGSENLSSLIQAETTMITSKMILSVILAATTLVGIVGMSNLNDEGVPRSNNSEARVAGVVSDNGEGESQQENEAPGDVVLTIEGEKAAAVSVNDNEPELTEAEGRQRKLVEAARIHSEETAKQNAIDDEQSMEKLAMQWKQAREKLLEIEAENKRLRTLVNVPPETTLERLEKQNKETLKAAVESVRRESNIEVGRLVKLLMSRGIDPAGDVSDSAFKPWPADAEPTEQWMYSLLDKTIPHLDYPGECPLSEILDEISQWANATYGTTAPSRLLVIHEDTAQFELEGINSLEDIAVRDVQMEGITVRNALELIFAKTTEPQLTYEFRNEVMVVTPVSKTEDASSYASRVYDIGNLELGASVEDAIPQLTPGLDWEVNGGPGVVRIVGNKLVVRQNFAGHQKVVRLLNQLASLPDSAVSKLR